MTNGNAQKAGDLDEDSYLQFLLAHIDPRFESDTNMDVGEVMIALAYPVVVVIPSRAERDECSVDVTQAGVEIEEDCYPLKQFLERFPQVARLVVEAHNELRNSYLKWHGSSG